MVSTFNGGCIGPPIMSAKSISKRAALARRSIIVDEDEDVDDDEEEEEEEEEEALTGNAEAAATATTPRAGAAVCPSHIKKIGLYS